MSQCSGAVVVGGGVRRGVAVNGAARGVGDELLLIIVEKNNHARAHARARRVASRRDGQRRHHGTSLFITYCRRW